MATRKQDLGDEDDPYYRDALINQMKQPAPGASAAAPPPGGTVQGQPGAELPGIAAGAPEMPGAQLAPKGPTDWSRLNGGYNRDKLNDPTHTSAKYTIGRTLNDFDPRGGFTPELFAKLNALGYGKFGGDGGDGIDFSGVTDAGRAAGLGGDFKGADWIQGFKGDSPMWNYADPFAEAQAGPAAGAAPQPGMGGQPQIGAIDQLGDLSGNNILQRIQQALAQYTKG